MADLRRIDECTRLDACAGRVRARGSGEATKNPVITKTGLDILRYICNAWFGVPCDPQMASLTMTHSIGPRHTGHISRPPVMATLNGNFTSPSVTPVGERFDPMWEADEFDTIRQVMETGLALLEAELRV